MKTDKSRSFQVTLSRPLYARLTAAAKKLETSPESAFLFLACLTLKDVESGAIPVNFYRKLLAKYEEKQ
jgi:hypothetical protein